MPLVTPVPRPKSRALLIGTRQYRSEQWNAIAAGVTAEIELATDIFRRRLEYDNWVVEYADGDSSLRRAVSDWAHRPGQGTDDVNVLYYTGHGYTSQAGQLRLITSDIEPGREHTAIAATEIIGWLEPLVGSALVILDTCYSGAVAADALQLLARQAANVPGGARIQFITSARPIEEARPGWFMEALAQALDRAGTKYEPWLAMDKVMGRVNRYLAEQSSRARLDAIRARAREDGIDEDAIARMLNDEKEKEKETHGHLTSQHAHISGTFEELGRFFPNRSRLDFTNGIDDAQALRVLDSIQQDALRHHWDPRARGASAYGDPGWYFSGRQRALARLKELVDGTASGLIAVTGMAGSGKSAVLARFATLADAEQRRRADAAGVTRGIPADALPSVGSIDFAIYARDRTRVSLAMEIALCAGGKIDGDWDGNPEGSLIDVLRPGKHRRRVLLLDALDEATNPHEAATLLQRIAQADCGLLLIVGLRTDPSGGSDLLDRLAALESLNLDAEDYWSPQDLEEFVERYLLTHAGSPYAATPATDHVSAREVARDVAARAERSFLVAVTTARALAARSEQIARGQLAELPTSVGDAFELDLQRFKGAAREARLVLGVLAYARGRGLPRTLWPRVVAALAPDWKKTVGYWEDEASFYVVRSQVKGEEVCRLYHDEFARYLREKLEAEDLRCANDGCAHYTVDLCVAMTMYAEAGRTRAEGMSRHLLDHLVAYLVEAGCFKELSALEDSGFLEESLAATRDARTVTAAFEMVLTARAALDDMPGFLSCARRRQNALGLRRQIVQTPGLLLLQLDACPPEHRQQEVERIASTAALIVEPLHRAQALLAFYRSASHDYPELVTNLPQQIFDATRGLPSGRAKSAVHDQLVAAVAESEPKRVSWLESCELEPNVWSIMAADLADGYVRSGDPKSALRLLRRAIAVAMDDGPFVTLEPSRVLAIAASFTDRAALEDLIAAAAAKADQTGTRGRGRAQLVLIGLLAQVGREAEAVSLLDDRVARLERSSREADEKLKWQLALTLASTIEVMARFQDQSIRQRAEAALVLVAQALGDTGYRRVATQLARTHGLRVDADGADAATAVHAVATLLPLELGRHSDGASILVRLTQKCTRPDHAAALLELLNRLMRTTEYNDRAVCGAAAIVALVRCGDLSNARVWYDLEAPRDDGAHDLQPEAWAAFAAAAHALGEFAMARLGLRRAIDEFLALRDQLDIGSTFDALLRVSDFIEDPTLRVTLFDDLIRAAASPRRTTSISNVCLRAHERCSRSEQLHLAETTERTLAQPRPSASSFAAVAASIKAFAAAGLDPDAAAVTQIAFEWFRAVRDEREMPFICESLVSVHHPGVDRELLPFMIQHAKLAPDAYHGTRALATLVLGSDGRAQDELREGARVLLDRIEREIKELSQMDALGTLAGAGAACADAVDLQMIERLDAAMIAARPDSGGGAVSSLGWLSARANCSLAYIPFGSRGRAGEVLNDTLDDELIREWVEKADWADRPLELARAALTIDQDDISLPTLIRLKNLAQGQQCAAIATARAVAQVIVGEADVPWRDRRVPVLPLAVRIGALQAAEELLDIGKGHGFSGLDAELNRYALVSGQALLARAYGLADRWNEAARVAADALESLTEIHEEQPQSWTLSALIKHCPDQLAERRTLEEIARDTVGNIPDLSNRSALAQAFLESTPFERLDMSKWLAHLASKPSTNTFSQTAVALFRRPDFPDSAQYPLLHAAALREPEDLLLVTAGIARRTTGTRRSAALQHLRELLSLSESGTATVGDFHRQPS